ncbi:hypothetical protein DV113_000546 [Geotrichum candidum]|nr:hypothetical protein DV454_001785 [Geotrichum candidum]KAF5124640.1 hypothetical protein DV452_000022 [Geotrichum candidum]KAF7501467.1 hypothetical protein DV113_000546 [Geotrichum candidum]KAI8135144.1 hypothetical protein DUD61_001131 [Geotrichum candidum]KAI9213688.1 hypothetical protein DS838_001476 [Geotrichum bryndzae]
MSLSSLSEYYKRNIFRIIDSVQPAAKVSIEILDSRRSSQNYLDAIYIVEPTTYNVECISADYTIVPPRYAGAHIFFTSGFTTSLNKKVQNSAIARHIRRLEPVYIDFSPLESHTFSLNCPNALEIFYNDGCADILQRAISKIAQQLVSVCATLGEYPIIRFYEADKTERISKKLTYMIAKEFQNELDSYARNHPDFPDTSEGRPRGVFLILDRAIDWIAPLLHEFTYQAIAYDLLPMKDWNKYTYTETIMGKEQTTEGMVSEKDPEWVSLRHTHMEKATGVLQEKLAKLKKDNPHLADLNKDVRVNDLKDMMLNVPGFIEMRDRYTLHVAIATDCMDVVTKRNLIDLAILEQICATGVNEDRSKPKGVADEFVAMLADERLNNTDKIRLILLYALFRHGLIEEDFQKLSYHCGLTPDDITTIKNYVKLGAPILKESAGQRITKKELPTRFDSHATGQCFAMSRYVPGVYGVVEKLIHGELSPSLFPYIKDQPLEDEDSPENNSVSLRNPRQRAVWARSGSTQIVKQRIFVFMAGGMTPSETRSCYELAQLHSKEFIIGGTDFVTGTSMVRHLHRLTEPRQQLGLAEDVKLPTRAPNFLFESDREIEARKKAQQQQQQQQQQSQQTKPQAGAITGRAQTAPSAAPSQEVKKEKKKNKFGRFFK